MSTVKENSLNEEMAQTALMFLRLITSKLTGDSKLIQIQKLILQISNIYGLQTIIDGLQTLVTGSESEIPIFDALGQIESSNFKIGTFDTIESLDLCTQQGLYTASDVVAVPIVGDVQFSLVVLGHRLLFGTNGLWHSLYSSSWSSPRYVGGAFDNITISYADAIDLASNGQLSPGAHYKITGVGQDDGIILRAASADTFETDGIRFGIVPAHFEAGTYDSVEWLGQWRDSLTPSVGNVVIFCGRVWENKTGSVGSVSSDWFLDYTNWELIDPLIGTNEGFYIRECFGCTYRLVSNLPLVFTTGYISRQWDSRGNSFGIDVEPADGFKVEYNDCGNDKIYGNNLVRCYNNILESGATMTNNIGHGYIYNCDIQVMLISNKFNANFDNPSQIHDCAISSAWGNEINSIVYRCEIDNAYRCIFNDEFADNTFVVVSDSIFNGEIKNKNFNGHYLESYCVINENDAEVETFSIDRYIRDDITPFKATDGETLRLSTPVYNDINAAIASAKLPASSAPTWRTDFDTHLGAFTFAINDHIDIGTIELLHDYKEGTDLEVHLHLATRLANDATARKAKYVIYYSYGIPDSGAYQFTAEASLTAEVNIAANAPNKTALYLSMGTISGTGLKIGTQIKMALYRIAGTGTEPANDPYLGQVGIHYQVDTLGSRSILTK